MLEEQFMANLRGAIIGCGFFGNIQLEAWRRMADVEMVAACDASLDRARATGFTPYTDAGQMMDAERLDFVDIATRPDTHLPLIRAAVERGLPAICQKPMAESMPQAIEIANLVQQTGARVMIHENWRWQPWYREARQRIAGGSIGQPLNYTFRIRQRDGLGDNPFPNQPYFREMPRLLIYETLIHPLDTARFLFGEIATVRAHIRRFNPLLSGEDRAVLILTHEGGTDGVIDGNRYVNPDPPGPAMGDAVFEGTDGVIRIEANGNLFLNGTLAWSPPTEAGYKGDSVRATQQHFVDCLQSGNPFETGVDTYLASYAAVEAAYRSAAEGRVIPIQEMLRLTP
jgi:predicted dehydrogenase